MISMGLIHFDQGRTLSMNLVLVELLFAKLIAIRMQVKCTENVECSGYPVPITITNECPGACNDQHFHFDLSYKAFRLLAKRGQGFALQKHGIINIQYRR